MALLRILDTPIVIRTVLVLSFAMMLAIVFGLA